MSSSDFAYERSDKSWYRAKFENAGKRKWITKNSFNAWLTF